MKSRSLAKAIAELALTKKAHDVIIMDLRPLTSMTDFFVVCTAASDTQAKAIAGAVDDGLSLEGEEPWRKELGSSNWMLLDYVDVVFHVFLKDTRSFYALEKLWGDAEIEQVSDEPTPTPKILRKAKSASKKKPVKKAAVAKEPVKKAAVPKKPVKKSARVKKPVLKSVTKKASPTKKAIKKKVLPKKGVKKQVSPRKSK